MKIDIRARTIDLSASLRDHIERRLLFALGRFGTRIFTVTVTLEDLNGPRGGIDKQCRMTVVVAFAGQLRVEVRDTDLLTAVDRAADRLGRTVARASDRHFSYPRPRVATVRIAGDALFHQRESRDLATRNTQASSALLLPNQMHPGTAEPEAS